MILNKTCIAKLFPVESESKSFGTVPDSAFISSSVFRSRGKIRICDTVNSIIPVVFRDLLGTVPGTGAISKTILQKTARHKIYRADVNYFSLSFLYRTKTEKGGGGLKYRTKTGRETVGETEPNQRGAGSAWQSTIKS